MRERWLHTLWARQDWQGIRLQTHSGQTVHVLHPGTWNDGQGPDFFQAQLFLDQILWVGSIEIHVRSSDWFLHNHPTDLHYLPVILHVVWQMDARYPDLPTLELSRYFSFPQLRESVWRMGDIASLPCHRILRPVPNWLWAEWREQLLNDRIVRKRSTEPGSTEVSIRRLLARQMGAWINRDVFESIEASISATLLSAVRYDLNAITALWLGQAGLLNKPVHDAYSKELKHLYHQLRKQFVLNPPYRHLLWMRQRPAADPSFRLAQLAALIHMGWDAPARWQTEHHQTLSEMFGQIEMHAYWRQHRSLDEGGVTRGGFFSKGVIEGLMINVWSWVKDSDQAIKTRWALFGFEDNRITRLFQYLELPAPTAADSQALLELHHRFCQHRKCGSCALAAYWIQDQAPQST